jgi:prevent-host-death family protein
MGSVGIRELRQRASELLRRVEQGETIEITDRGRRVAILSSAPEGSPLERLRSLAKLILRPGISTTCLHRSFFHDGSSVRPVHSLVCGSTSADPWPHISIRQPS